MSPLRQSIIPEKGARQHFFSSVTPRSRNQYTMVCFPLVARETVAAMWASGADVAKVATTARDITDARRMLALLEERSGALLDAVADDPEQLACHRLQLS